MVMIIEVTECQVHSETENTKDTIDYISLLKDTLMILSEKSDNEYFKMHCNSMISVINSNSSFTLRDSTLLKFTYDALNNDADTANPKMLSSYIKRQRRFILSWVSPTDSAISFTWLRPPKNWDPKNAYPLYIQLHGDWNVALNSIDYMTYPFITEAAKDSSFNDGYLLEPWGRGNLWSEGMAIPDFWEGIAALEEIVKIDPTRKYISGHSMGGYGAMLIASLSPNVWAALGIHSGAIGYPKGNLINSATAETMKNMPTYFVLGTEEEERLFNNNQKMYQLFVDAGNTNIQWVTYDAGHVYIEENVENMYLWMRNFVNEDWSTGIEKTQGLYQNDFQIRSYPNPVQSFSHILYTISENSSVNMRVYNMNGGMVCELVNEVKIPGEYEATYDVSKLTAGIYLIRLIIGDIVFNSKLAVAR